LLIVIIENKKITSAVELVSDKGEMNERVVDLYDKFLDHMHDLDDAMKKPDCVYVEQAVYVKNIKTTLGIDAVVNAVRFISHDFDIPCFIIDNKHWKLQVCGNGKAEKTEIMQFAKLKFGEAKLTSQDIADAACIALCGYEKVGK